MLPLYIEAALGHAQTAGGAGAVADVAERALQAVCAELANLIGNYAVRALYLRAAHVSLLSSTRPDQGSVPLDALLSDLRQKLADHEPAESRRVALSLLESLVALLASLIGRPLTMRVVASAWGSIPVPSTITGENPHD